MQEMMDRDLVMIEDARRWFVDRLQEHPPVKMTTREYLGGVSALNEELRKISAQASDEIQKKHGVPLSYNQASIALISAMNGLKLIEVVPA